MIKLFNDSIRLRRKVKYSTLAAYNQDTYLEALNSKVEYRKSLFLFAIVVCELISSLFTIMSSVDGIVYYFTNHYINLDHHLLDYHLNITNTDPIKDQLNIHTPVSNHSEYNNTVVVLIQSP